ncbi:MAG TPA: hypothetical protein VMR54_10130 [Thermoanaerobaculia bacterium]|nr:hypothetical protein [Thermoanaerobaculia bacterium]
MRARGLALFLPFVSAAAAAANQTITIGPGISFSPTSVTVAPGEMVTWMWDASNIVLHSTTSDSQVGPEVWDSGLMISGSFAHTFNTTGDYPFYCKYHSLPADQGGFMMNGIVHVVVPTTPTNTPTQTNTPTPTPTPTATLTPTPTPTATPPVGRDFFSVPPCRAINTRTTDGPALSAGSTRTFVLATGAPVGNCTIPATAKAVSINVTITQPDADGDLRLYPGGGLSPPLVSTINYRAGQTRANNAMVSLGASGDITVKCDQAFGLVHLLVDINGYSQ